MAKNPPNKKDSRKGAPKSGETNHVILGLLLVLIALVAFGGMLGGAGVGGMIV